MIVTADYPPLDWRHGQPGFAALLVVGALAIGLTLLLISFAKHVKKAREPWEGEE